MYILSISENILLFVCGLGILQGMLLAALIFFHPKSERSVNTFLALYIFCISCVMTMPITIEVIGWQNSYFIQPLPLLPGIFLYFYIRSFKGTISWRKALPHFIIILMFFFLSYWNITEMTKLYPGAVEHVPVEGLLRPSTIGIMTIRVGQQILYFLMARRALMSYQHSIQHLFSNTSRINLNWAKFLINGYLVLICTFLVVFPLMIRCPEHFNSLFLFNMAMATPYIYLATYKGIIQPTIWQTQPGLSKETVESEIQQAEELETVINNLKEPKIIKAGWTQERLQEIIGNITILMEQEKLYQEPELTLNHLANKLKIPTYQVSQSLNEGMKKNFYDLVNGYRVEEAKRLLLDPKNGNYTILSVGFEAGFNSKTTFNTVFKKFTGLTPTEFKEKRKEAVFV
jgi:AraC-like DNA-binding protein